MKPIKRRLENQVMCLLDAFPAVYLAGPRQSGKTTLVRQIAAQRLGMSYVSFDDIQTREAAQHDPESFLRSFKGPVVLDEVQIVPEIFRPLKIVIDDSRNQSGRGCGRFLLTGSASVMALPKLSDALVGRMALQTLLPFSACELMFGAGDTFIDRSFSQIWSFEQREPIDLQMLFRKTSFPEIFLLGDDQLADKWCNGYLNTILQRDIRDLLQIDKAAAIPDLLRLLASRTGGVLNEASLTRDMSLNHVTVKKYRILLESLFLTLSVAPWFANLGKRLVKSPKVYLGDLNLWAYLLAIPMESLAQKNPMLSGQVLENFVAIELSKQMTFCKTTVRLYHYRTSNGQEIDFLLEGPEGRVVAIEVKAASKVSAKDFRHIQSLKSDLGERFYQGFVVYQGADVVPFGKDLFAVPLSALWC